MHSAWASQKWQGLCGTSGWQGVLSNLLNDPAAELWPERKVWTTALDEAHARRYDREASDLMEHLPVLCAGAICGAWITNPLEHNGSITFTTDEWQVLCNFRLGLPLPSGRPFLEAAPPTGRIRGPRPLLPGV